MPTSLGPGISLHLIQNKPEEKDGAFLLDHCKIRGSWYSWGTESEEWYSK